MIPIGVRAIIHLGGGGRPSFARMDSVEGGGVVAEVCRARFGGGGGSGRICSVNCSNRPYFRVIQTCIVFCPNNVDSLPEC